MAGCFGSSKEDKYKENKSLERYIEEDVVNECRECATRYDTDSSDAYSCFTYCSVECECKEELYEADELNDETFSVFDKIIMKSIKNKEASSFYEDVISPLLMKLVNEDIVDSDHLNQHLEELTAVNKKLEYSSHTLDDIEYNLKELREQLKED